MPRHSVHTPPSSTVQVSPRHKAISWLSFFRASRCVFQPGLEEGGGGNRGEHSSRPCLPTTRNGPRHPRNCHSTMFSFIAPYHVPRPPFPSLYHPCRLAFSFSGKGITRAGVPSCNISGRCCSRLFPPGDSLSSVGRGEFNIEILLCRMRYPTERLAGFL